MAGLGTIVIGAESYLRREEYRAHKAATACVRLRHCGTHRRVFLERTNEFDAETARAGATVADGRLAGWFAGATGD